MRAVFPLKSIQVTSRFVQIVPPTKLTVHSPTHASTEAYPEFPMKAGPAPRISLQLHPLQDHHYKTKKLQQLKLQTTEMTTRDDDATTVTPAAKKLKPPTADRSVEDMHKEFTVPKPLLKFG